MNEKTHRFSPWLWEELEPGMSFAPQQVTITERDLRLWRVISSGNGDGPLRVGRALLAPLMMRAFIKASEPRPPGNIHVAQELRFSSRAPVLGEALFFTFTIGNRAERKGRGWIDIIVGCRSGEQGQFLMAGKMVLIWAGRRICEAVRHG